MDPPDGEEIGSACLVPRKRVDGASPRWNREESNVNHSPEGNVTIEEVINGKPLQKTDDDNDQRKYKRTRSAMQAGKEYWL
ncbi:Hypothetical protein FKW44_013196, partial [Caligus rogercresseyi]